ncbi:MAG: hypothetical protein AAFV19_00960 [Pseudomonadota bacterium]
MAAKDDDPTNGMDAGQRRVHLHQISGWLWLIGLPGCMAIGALVFVIKLQFGATYSAIVDLGLFFVIGLALEVKLYARLTRWQLALGPEGTWMDRALRGRLGLLKIEACLEANPGLGAAVGKGTGYPVLKRYFMLARLAGHWGDLALLGLTATVVLSQRYVDPKWACQMLSFAFIGFRLWLIQHAANHFAEMQHGGLSEDLMARFDDLDEVEQAQRLTDAERHLAGSFSLLNPFGRAHSV